MAEIVEEYTTPILVHLQKAAVLFKSLQGLLFGSIFGVKKNHAMSFVQKDPHLQWQN